MALTPILISEKNIWDIKEHSERNYNSELSEEYEKEFSEFLIEQFGRPEI
jgi:hypothetical protein